MGGTGVLSGFLMVHGRILAFFHPGQSNFLKMALVTDRTDQKPGRAGMLPDVIGRNGGPG